MSSKRIWMLCLSFVLVLLSGCASGSVTSTKGGNNSDKSAAAPASGEGNKAAPIKIKLIGTLPIKSYGNTALTNFKTNVEKASNGSITIDTFPAGQLYNDKDAVNVIPTGAVDMGMVQLDMWTGKAPNLGVLYIPMLFDNYDHFYKSRDKMFDQLDKVLQEKAQVKLIGWFNYNDQTIISKAPIKSIDDFKGKRLRGWGEYSSAMLEYAGSTAISMAAGDVYDALSKGVIDGAMSTPVSHIDRKFYEVAKYVTDMSLEPVTPYAILVNLNTWNKLSKDQQKVLQDAAKEVDTWSQTELKKETSAAMEDLKKKGATIESITGDRYNAIRSAVLPKLTQKYISQTGKDGEVLLKVVEDLRGK